MPGMTRLVAGPAWATTSAADRAALIAAFTRHSVADLCDQLRRASTARASPSSPRSTCAGPTRWSTARSSPRTGRRAQLPAAPDRRRLADHRRLRRRRVADRRPARRIRQHGQGRRRGGAGGEAQCDRRGEAQEVGARFAGPSSAGSKISAQTSVHARLIIRILPMLAVPGWRDSHRLPNAVPVASALNSTARARLDVSSSGRAAAPRHDEIDVERDADAEQQREGDDVGEVDRLADDDARRQRQEPRQDDGGEREGDLADRAQDAEQQQRDRGDAVDAREDERPRRSCAPPPGSRSPAPVACGATRATARGEARERRVVARRRRRDTPRPALGPVGARSSRRGGRAAASRASPDRRAAGSASGRAARSAAR